MRRHRKHREDSGFNVWRSYSDMMAGLLLLFVLIMCVTLFQAQKSYNDSIKERDDRIAMQEQYNAEIEDKQNTVNQQADQLKTKDELLAEQEARLQALAAQLEEQQATLDEQAARLNEQSTLLNQQQSDLDQKTAELLNQQAKIEKIIGVKADVIEALQEEFQNNNVSVDIDSQTGAMTLDTSVMFDYNESELTREGRRVLKEVLPIYCDVLLQDEYLDYVAEIIIDGYTDTSGDYNYNMVLSQNRAYAVAEYLLAMERDSLEESQYELLKERLSVNGHSMSNPILDAEGNVDMEASRRVEVKFRVKDEEMINELSAIMSSSQVEDAADGRTDAVEAGETE